jgi:hypothetical protein
VPLRNVITFIIHFIYIFFVICRTLEIEQLTVIVPSIMRVGSGPTESIIRRIVDATRVRTPD